jgi:hypothetical protein
MDETNQSYAMKLLKEGVNVLFEEMGRKQKQKSGKKTESPTKKM